jgi:hypothetical protein
MRLTVTLAALTTAAVLMMPAPSAEAGGLRAGRADMKCFFDLFRRDRAAPVAAPVKKRAKRPAK